MPDSILIKKNHSKSKFLLADSLSSFASIYIVFSCVFIGIRVYELSYGFYSNAIPNGRVSIFSIAILKDIVFLLVFFLWNYLLYFVFWWINKKMANIISVTLFISTLLIQFLLVKYFLTTLVPLGADFWAYSWKDIQETVTASGGVHLTSLVPFVFILLLIYIAFRYLPKKITLAFWLLSSILCISILVNIWGVDKKISRLSPVKQEFGNNLSDNKFAFFLTRSQQHFFPKNFELDIYDDNYFGDGKAASNFTEFAYTNESDFPFLHQETTPDVLSPFFDTAVTTPPNIVFIVAEGLGRAFSNEGAYWGNFTPFLDSLSKKSLYWKNCLSQGGRTFAVLPALLGSLPFGSNGFLDMDRKMPDHFSLLNLLRQQNYSTAFYYGGNASFDNMDRLLRKNNINTIADEKTFPGTYTKMPTDENGFCWGYGDKELFRRYLETQKINEFPYMDVLLTVSTHNPFRINEQEHYLQRFEERMSELKYDESQKDEHRHYKYQGASILFLDDAIKGFFSAYSKRSDFGNTVFIITGDHRMPEIPMSSKIDRYHVPLIIYSPLLKRTSTFSSIIAHNDIAPSLLAWLQKQYKVPIPVQTTWLSHGLDTGRSFRNIQPIAFMQTKNGISDFLFDQYFLHENNDLYSLNESMDLDKSDNPAMKEKLKMLFTKFVQKNNALMESGMLLPDTLYRKYIVK